jgi:hypothetical protein|nr:MAG TPA: putative peptidyl-prolyl cis-trans isomerase [Caudoviricetes sp.]
MKNKIIICILTVLIVGVLSFCAGSRYTITHQKIQGDVFKYVVVFNGSRYGYSVENGKFMGLA